MEYIMYLCYNKRELTPAFKTIKNMLSYIKEENVLTAEELRDVRQGLIMIMKVLDKEGGPNDKKLADRLEKIEDKLRSWE